MGLIIINLLVVFYTHSGIPRIIRRTIWNFFYKIPFNEDFLMQPIECSLCMGFGAGLFSLIGIGFTPMNIAAVALLAFFNDLLGDILEVTKEVVIKVIDCIYRFIH